MSMTHLSLFSGIGGLDLAAEWAGFQTVGQCEIEDYPTKILEKHWPDVPRWRDIRTLGGDAFYGATGLRTVDVLSGGFPCQPFSVAGKRRGKDDDRYLWPEMLRVIRELRPAWIVGENVAGFVNMALDTALTDLEAEGYETRSFVLPACGVGAPHQRYRVAIVAHADNAGLQGRYSAKLRECSGKWAAGPGGVSVANAERPERRSRESAGDVAYREDAGRTQTASGAGTSGENGGGRIMADTSCFLWDGRLSIPKQAGHAELTDGGRRPAQPGLGGNSDGFPRWLDGPGWPAPFGCGQYAWEPPRTVKGMKHRRDRLKCLGNAVVPEQAYPIFAAIAQIEKDVCHEL